MENVLLISFLFFLVAALYSTVGHAGASGYLAVMGLLSFSPESIKPLVPPNAFTTFSLSSLMLYRSIQIHQHHDQCLVNE